MSNELVTILNSDEGFEISAMVGDDGKVWFPATDTAERLGYKNARQAVIDHCSEAGVANRDVSYPSGAKKVRFINEANLYRLIMRSKLPNAERFQDWVCEEVLPAIRKTGGYSKAEPMDQLDFLQHQLDLMKAHRAEVQILNARINIVEANAGKRIDAVGERVEEIEDTIEETLAEYKDDYDHDKFIEVRQIRDENFPGISTEVVSRLLRAVEHPMECEKLAKGLDRLDTKMYLAKGLKKSVSRIFDSIEFEKETLQNFQFSSHLLDSTFRVRKDAFANSRVVAATWQPIIDEAMSR